VLDRTTKQRSKTLQVEKVNTDAQQDWPRFNIRSILTLILFERANCRPIAIIGTHRDLGPLTEAGALGPVLGPELRHSVRPPCPAQIDADRTRQQPLDLTNRALRTLYGEGHGFCTTGSSCLIPVPRLP
jgi:hypothetical protein